MKRLRIIHLSDIHYSNSEDNKKLMNSLSIDLANMKNEVDSYQLLLITGDVIDKGQVDSYTVFEKYLGELENASGIASERVFIVPGNHDYYRNTKNRGLEKILADYKGLCKEDRVAQSTVFHKDSVAFLTDFSAFLSRNSYSAIDDVAVMDIDGAKVCLMSIDSSWSTVYGNKYGELVIDDEQIKTFKQKYEEVVKTEVDVCIALMHHPLDWFEYASRSKLMHLFEDLRVDILLHGHVHESFVQEVMDVDSSLISLCTGIAYIKSGESCSRKDGMRYSIYDLNFDTKIINVYVRSTNGKMAFVGDNRLYNKAGQEGFFTVPFGKIDDCSYPLFSASDKAIRTNKLLLTKEFFSSFIEIESTLSIVQGQIMLNSKDWFTKTDYDRWLNLLERSRSFDDSGEDTLSEENDDNLKVKYVDSKSKLLCESLANSLKALFSDFSTVRVMFRKYDSELKAHTCFHAVGVKASPNDQKGIKSFEWPKGMIGKSFEKKQALLWSMNKEFAEDGNHPKRFREYLTMTISTVMGKGNNKNIPLYSLNIATTSANNELDFLSLSLSSIYTIMNTVFADFSAKSDEFLTSHLDAEVVT